MNIFKFNLEDKACRKTVKFKLEEIGLPECNGQRYTS